jgi:hypothetical protein
MNSVDSLGTVHFNSVSTIDWTASDPVIFFLNCVLLEKLVFNNTI